MIIIKKYCNLKRIMERRYSEKNGLQILRPENQT